MTMRGDLITRLKANTGVTDIVTQSIGWFERGRDWALPALVLQTVTSDRDWTHDGPTGLDRQRVQFDCYAASDAGADALALAVRAAMEPAATVGGTAFFEGFLRNESGFVPEDLGDGKRVFRLSLDIEFYHQVN